jgi:hypothetical protein
MSKKAKGVNPELENAIAKMLSDVMSDPTATLVDKCRVMDRAINIEKLKMRLSDDDWGAGFFTPDDDE